ncbi:MAG: AgmX/PglI C-terminal domain-containing protein, partial [Candidatus Coatesbacteria bacterium]|nr:AgmX/PglI C-terminal domain-containing protein [Candidatus Coatesbacteria bacterium]
IKQQISSVVNGGKGNIRRLYNDYTKRGAKIEGKLDVMIIISPEGGKDVKLLGSLPEDFKSAVMSSIRGWQFPKPGSRVTLRFSFTFVQM